MSNEKINEGLEATATFKDEVKNDFEQIKKMKDEEMKAAMDELMKSEEFQLASNMNKQLMQSAVEQEAELQAIHDNVIDMIKETIPKAFQDFNDVLIGSGMPVEKFKDMLDAVIELNESAMNSKIKSSNYFLGKISEIKFKGDNLSQEENVINSALDTYAGVISLFIVKLKTIDALEDSIESLNTIIVNDTMLSRLVDNAKTWVTTILSTDIEEAIQTAPIKERPILRQRYAIVKAHQAIILNGDAEAYTLVRAVLKRNLEKLGRVKNIGVAQTTHHYKIDAVMKVPVEIAGKIVEVTEVSSKAEMILTSFLEILFANTIDDMDKIKIFDTLSVPSYSNMKIALVSKIFDTIEELSRTDERCAAYKELIDRIKEAEEIHARQLKIAEEAINAANIASAELSDKGLIKNPYEVAAEMKRVNGESELVTEAEVVEEVAVTSGDDKSPDTVEEVDSEVVAEEMAKI